MPAIVTEDQYEALLEKHCGAIRKLKTLMEQGHSMKQPLFDAVFGLLDVKDEELKAENQFKDKFLRERNELTAGLSMALAICRKHGLHHEIAHLVALETKYPPKENPWRLALPTKDVTRWN